MKKHYTLRCLGDNTHFEDIWYPPHTGNNPHAGNMLKNPHYNGDALLRSEYTQPLHINTTYKSILKYSWLPVTDTFDYMAAPITFKSKGFADYLGLTNLYCSYSGYFPSLHAYNPTCSFKEYEAIGVLARHGLCNDSIIVLASAGNTARAFANLISHLVSQEGESTITTRIVLIVPKDNLPHIWTLAKPAYSHVLLCEVEGDYADTIAIANTIATQKECSIEGGVRNVGRRDGMGCTFLSAVDHIGRIPDHYFQAVGSASGAISAWEASIRHMTIMDTKGSIHTTKLPQLHISQNAPFTPIIDSWKQCSPTLLPINTQIAKAQIAQISAPVLSNRTPPYHIQGGVYDAMKSTNGMAYSITNKEAQQARISFQEKEHIPIGTASAISCASLIQACHNNLINPNDTIMLNLTDGGQETLMKDHTLFSIEPHLSLSQSPNYDDLYRNILHYFKR